MILPKFIRDVHAENQAVLKNIVSAFKQAFPVNKHVNVSIGKNDDSIAKTTNL